MKLVSSFVFGCFFARRGEKTTNKKIKYHAAAG